MRSARRRCLVVGNWKMNLDEREADSLLDRLARSGVGGGSTDVAVAPTFLYVRRALDRLRGTGIRVAAQDHHSEDRGAFTGETSSRSLASMGVALAILGHSERRTLRNESDAAIAAKMRAAARNGLIPILCVGEGEAERDRGETFDIVTNQVRLGLAGWPGGSFEIAYEPVWAIGTGRTPTLREISEVHARIRSELVPLLGPAPVPRILYGGSVNAANAAAILRADGVDGSLVGGASIDAESFEAIVLAADRFNRLPADDRPC